MAHADTLFLSLLSDSAFHSAAARGEGLRRGTGARGRLRLPPTPPFTVHAVSSAFSLRTRPPGKRGPLCLRSPTPPSSKRSHHQHRFRSIDWWPTARKMWTSMDVEHSRGGVHKGGHLRPTERDKNATRQRRAGVGVDRSRASAGPVGRPTAEASCSAQHLVWWPQARQPVPAHPPGPFLLSSPVTPDENASQSTW